MVEFYKQYTKCNLLFIAVLLWFNVPFLNTIAFINCVAIFTSLHSSLLFDRDAFVKLAKPDTFSVFMFRNIIGHILPIFVVPCVMQLDYSHNAVIAGICSAGLHLLWMSVVHGSFCLDNAYCHMEEEMWVNMWIVAIFTHLSTGALLAMGR